MTRITFRSAAGVLVLAALFLLAGVRPAVAQVRNPANGHYYEAVLTANLTWTQAKAAAEARTFMGAQGHLATLTSAAENDFVYANLPTLNCWIGGFQPSGSPEPLGGWRWVTGEPFAYHNFNPNLLDFNGSENRTQFQDNLPTWNDLPDGRSVPQSGVHFCAAIGSKGT